MKIVTFAVLCLVGLSSHILSEISVTACSRTFWLHELIHISCPANLLELHFAEH